MRLGLVSVFLLGKTVRFVVHRLHLLFHMLGRMLLLLMRIFLGDMLLHVLFQLVLNMYSFSSLSHGSEVMRAEVGRVALSSRKSIS